MLLEVFLDEDELFPVYFIDEEDGFEKHQVDDLIYRLLKEIHRLWKIQQEVLRKKWFDSSFEIEKSKELRVLLSKIDEIDIIAKAVVIKQIQKGEW